MKRLILQILVVLFCYTANAQWRPFNLGTNNALSSVFFTSADTGYIVGEGIYKTTDGGTSWTSADSVFWPMINQYTAIPGSTNAVYFANADTGVIVCNGGEYLRTTNKGVTWNLYWLSTLPNFTEIQLKSVFFADTKNGYAVGGFRGIPGIFPSMESILKTSDGGITWTALTTPKTTMLKSVYFTSASTGYAVGDSGLIIKTTDGGTTWDTLSSKTKQFLMSVFFTDANNGFISGYAGVLLKTTDAGASWSYINTYTYMDIDAIYFPTATTGYAIGTEFGFKTTDGGNTWSWAGDSLSFVTYNSVFFTSANVGYVVGQVGVADKTTDGAVRVVNSISKVQSGDLILYPNPVHSTLYINSSYQNEAISIYDLQGKLILSNPNINNQINVSRLPRGVYVIKINDSNNSIVNKFIKE
jgi:photosystem II stability/assembly factor-like uncharacterized protein